MKSYYAWLVVWMLLCGALGAAACDDDDDENADDDDLSDDDAGDDDTADDDTGDDDDDDDDDDNEAADPFQRPEELGPFKVGVRSFIFVDESRNLSCGPGKRSLMTEIWYPAADNADEWPENYLHDFWMGRLEEVEQALEDAGMDPDGEALDVPTGSYRDAPLHPAAAPMPILIFSHGFSSNRFQNYTMARYLASHGYLVAAPDHTCNAKVTLTPDDVVLFSFMNAPLTLSERKADMSFLVDVLLDNPPKFLAGQLDEEHIAFWGHSFGGATATEQIKVDQRATALVQLAAFGLPEVPADLDVVSLYTSGREDKWMRPFESWHDQLIGNMPPPKFSLEFFDTGHFAFSDLCSFAIPLMEHGNGCGEETRIGSDELFTNPTPDQMHEVLNPYVTALFGAAFFDYPDLWEYLQDNHFPEMIEYFPTWSR